MTTTIQHLGYYAISASVERTVNGWTSTVALPTFHLNYAVQGIVSAEHAGRIARRMLEDTAGPDATVHVHHVEPVHGASID